MIAYHLSFTKIKTLDYTRKQYELDGLEWFHVNDYLDDLLSNKRKTEMFGDHLQVITKCRPHEGDIDAVQQVHCLLRPGGLFFLGLPTSTDDSSFIEFNAHRIYGSKRLNLLFEGWNKIDQVKSKDGWHSIFVLEKKNVC